MKASIGDFFRRRRAKKGSSSTDQPITLRPPPPYLPSERARPITPDESSQAHSQDQSRLLSLPYDIRHRILALAFGDQTVHMDLTWEHPRLPRPPVGSDHWNALRSVHGLLPGLDKTKPKDWHWQSSVCHRRGLPAGFVVVPPHLDVPPSLDRCREGQARFRICASTEGDNSGECLIGVMGWLLTCKQA